MNQPSYIAWRDAKMTELLSKQSYDFEDLCDIVTILRGEGSFGHQERDIVYSVVSSDESKRVVRAVRNVDPEAFVNTFKTDELKGFFYQRPTE